MENLSTYILLFLLYSFFGWVCEVIYTSIPAGHFINRGFLIGPYCPIYGFGAVFVLLLLNDYRSNPILLFIMSILIASVIEYITSFLLEKIFGLSLWDYSNQKFNLNGRICLKNLLMFGALSLAVVYVLNPLMLSLIAGLSRFTRRLLFIFFGSTILVDLGLTAKILNEIKGMALGKVIDLDEMTKLRTEVLEEVNEEKEQFKSELAEKLKGRVKYPHRRLFDAFPKMQIKSRPDAIKDLRENIEAYIKEKRA